MTYIATLAKIKGAANTVLSAVAAAALAAERCISAKVEDAAYNAVLKTDAAVLKAEDRVSDAEDALVEARAAHTEARQALRAKYEADKLALDKFHDAIFEAKTRAIYAAEYAESLAVAHHYHVCAECEQKLGVYFD